MSIAELSRVLTSFHLSQGESVEFDQWPVKQAPATMESDGSFPDAPFSARWRKFVLELPVHRVPRACG